MNALYLIMTAPTAGIFTRDSKAMNKRRPTGH